MLIGKSHFSPKVLQWWEKIFPQKKWFAEKFSAGPEEFSFGNSAQFFPPNGGFYSRILQKQYIKDLNSKNYSFLTETFQPTREIHWRLFVKNLTQNSESIPFQSPRLMEIHICFDTKHVILKTFLWTLRTQFWRPFQIFFLGFEISSEKFRKKKLTETHFLEKKCRL